MEVEGEGDYRALDIELEMKDEYKAGIFSFAFTEFSPTGNGFYLDKEENFSNTGLY